MPACVLKNAEMSFNFGAKPFKHPPTGGFVGVSSAPSDCVVNSGAGASAAAPAKIQNNAPQAVIIEPSRELAEQTLNQVKLFRKHLENPLVRDLLVVGGIPGKLLVIYDHTVHNYVVQIFTIFGKMEPLQHP